MSENSSPHVCPLCGLSFGEFARGHCGACQALRGSCAEEPRCPRCGYRFPRDSSLLKLARKLTGRRRAHGGA